MVNKTHAGHGKLRASGRYKRSDTGKTSKYSRSKDAKIHAKNKSEPGKPFTGDTMKVNICCKEDKCQIAKWKPGRAGKNGWKTGHI